MAGKIQIKLVQMFFFLQNNHNKERGSNQRLIEPKVRRSLLFNTATVGE